MSRIVCAELEIPNPVNLLNRLNDRDLTGVSTDRNVPDPLRTAARRKMTLGSKG